MTEKEKIGAYFKSLRESKPSFDYLKDKISQKELADSVVGISKNTILKIETGKANPSLDILMKLAHALGKKKVSVFDVEIDVVKYIRENNLG